MPVRAADRRLALGVAAVFSVAEAAAQLPLADAEARRWLQAQGLVRVLAGRRVVRWLDVVFHPDLGGAPTDAEPAPAPAPRARLARTPLQPLTRAAGAAATRSDRNTDRS